MGGHIWSGHFGGRGGGVKFDGHGGHAAPDMSTHGPHRMIMGPLLQRTGMHGAPNHFGLLRASGVGSISTSFGSG